MASQMSAELQRVAAQASNVVTSKFTQNHVPSEANDPSPSGTIDNSPALQRWDYDDSTKRVPEGRLTPRLQKACHEEVYAHQSRQVHL